MKLSDPDSLVQFRRCQECNYNLCEKCAPKHNKWPLLKFRKSILKFFTLIHMVAHTIITTKLFDNLSISVIFVNSMVMMIEDPTLEEQPIFFVEVDKIFLILYSVEMFLKIFGYGFVMNEGAYLRDTWNLLDFVIVISGYLTLLTEGDGGSSEEKSLDLTGLRVFRVMRPLKTISSIKGLKVLMQALLSAIPLLRDTIIILCFFFIIYAIAGT